MPDQPSAPDSIPDSIPGSIRDYHAHVYFDAATKATAVALREEIGARFEVALGRVHERPIGPHPEWSYQVAFAPLLFGSLIPWLALNRKGLTVFVHPNTGDDVPDHSDRAIWLGEQAEINLAALGD